jgi:nucleoside-diphosphate-sugar epimerase
MKAESIVASEECILVTGACGFICAKVVEVLLERGFRNLRCFIRPSGRLGRIREVIDQRSAGNRVELVSGDLLSRDDCGQIFLQIYGRKPARKSRDETPVLK